MGLIGLAGLACPTCHGPLHGDGGRQLVCASCRFSYPVIDGIPSFVPDTDDKAAPGATCALTVVIPALNEAANLERLLPELRKELQALEIVHEIIVVDGGSHDGTREVSHKHGALVEAQQAPGFGGALRTGFEQARGEFVLTLDADGSHDPTFLESLWTAARHNSEVVIASRYVPGGTADMPAWRLVFSRILNATFRRGLSLPVADLSSGYRLYARAALRQLDLRATDFDILEEILIRAFAAGYIVQEVPFRYKARMAGDSHVSLLKFGVSYLRTFLAMWKLRNSIDSADYDNRAYDSLVPLQRYWQRRRYRVISQQAAELGRVLDVGCGSSRILSARPDWVGLDIQMHKLRYARRFGNPLVHGSIFALPFGDAFFDGVVCSEVIEHVPADARVFDELTRVLKPGGRLILGTPDYDRWSWRALEWVYRRASPGGYADEHITHFGRANLEAYLAARGLVLERTDYVGRSEMILSLRKAAVTDPTSAPPPVSSALRRP